MAVGPDKTVLCAIYAMDDMIHISWPSVYTVERQLQPSQQM